MHDNVGQILRVRLKRRKQGQYIVDRRIKFRKGLQCRFLELIKTESKLTWEELGELLNVSEYTMRVSWRRERATLPLSITIKLLNLFPVIDFDTIRKEWIEYLLEPHWGQRKGGLRSIDKIRKSTITPIDHPNLNENLAEFVGIILGDGYVSTHVAVISNEYPLESRYTEYICKLVRNLFKIRAIIYQKGSVERIKIYSKSLVSFLKDIGVASFAKKLNTNICIPSWIFKRDILLRRCIRGLFDTDGSLYRKDKSGRP